MRTRFTTRGPSALAAALLALAACKSDGDDPATGASNGSVEAADACADQPEIGWLGAIAKDPSALEGEGGGWVAMYQRDYAEAAAKFRAAESKPRAAAGLARAHLGAAALSLGLARTQARAQAAYFAARAELDADAKALKKAPFFFGVAQHFAGDAAGAQATLQALAKQKGPYAALAGAWPSACPGEIEAADAWGQVAGLAACAGGPRPACPDAAKATPGPWSARISAYRAALCDPPGDVDVGALAALVAEPADRETLKGKGGISADVAYYDALGPWVLAQAHLRKAADAAAGEDPSLRLLRAWARRLSGDDAGAKADAAGVDLAKSEAADPGAFLLSGFSGPEALQAYLQTEAPAPGADALEAMHAATAAHEAAANCAGAPKGLQVLDELGLAPILAREALRRSARPLLDDKKTCGEALRLLRGTQDVENLESLSYLNEPSALVALAEAAVCMRRSAEAIGALRAVRTGYPHAEGALAAARQLSVVRLMGGTGGTQKIQ